MTQTLTIFILIATTLIIAPPLRGDDTPSPLLRTFIDEFVEITPGRGQFPATFEIGSTRGDSEQPVHQVTIERDFSIARYEVPQNLYELVMGNNPSRWTGPRNSVEMMTWKDAIDFCEAITRALRDAKLIDADEVIRLPSEAEWEYCCRAGTTTAYSFGDSATADGDTGKQARLLDPYGWHTGNAAGNDPPVGALKPNPWGLYDMHGYLWEFTGDAWLADYADAPTDGSSAITNKQIGRIVIRGGSWKDGHNELRSSRRKPFATTDRDDAVGFRCVRAKRVKAEIR